LSRRAATACATVVLCALGAPAGAGAAAYAPPPGKVFAGVTGGLERGDFTSFASLVGHRPAVWQLFLTWDQDRGENPYLYVRTRLALARDLRTRLALSLTTAARDGRERVSPGQIARGAGDVYLLGLNRELGAAGDVVYVRPYGEMNQATNPYSAFGPRGRRGRDHSTAWFRRAWKRTALILRGGDVTAIDRQLRADRLPPVRTARSSLPTTRIALVWCPQVAGDPNVRGNSPGAYWPGGGYVDWVCTDFYSGFPNWGGLERFYRAWARRRPFAFGEWGIYRSGDAPGFARRLMGWVATHRRVRMVLFNQGNEPGGPMRLQRHPRTAAVLRAALRHPRYSP
jgi:hypothetical protein